MSDGKYYWLKLKRDFFKRHDMKIIKGLPDGHGIALFYLEMLAESIDHEGELRYSEKKPYTAETLALALSFDKELAEKALKVLEEFELIEVFEDGTIYLPEFQSMSGSETEWARQKREWRDKKGQEKDTERTKSGQCQDNVRTMSDKSIEIRDKSLDIERNIKERKFKKPTLEEINSYCQERKNSIDAQKFFDYYESKGWLVGKSPMKDWKAAVRNWERNEQMTSHCPTPKKNPYDIDWESLGVKK